MVNETIEASKIFGKVGQEQIHTLLFGEKLSWQAIIYDLINTEQLDPWDIDICLLAHKYLEKVRQLEEANFFISSKVLLASSLLLRMKSEILLNEDIRSLDDILFNREKEKHFEQQRIELDEEIPGLVPRTPLPRGRKVSLEELMAALGRAIKTETRRIKRVVSDKQREIEALIALPRKSFDLRGQIDKVYNKIKNIHAEKGQEKIAFSSFSGTGNEEKVAHFLPLLYLDYQHRILAEQEKSFDEIWVWLKEVHQKKHAEILEQMRKEVSEFLEQEAKRLKEEDAVEKVEEESGDRFKDKIKNKIERDVESEESD